MLIKQIAASSGVQVLGVGDLHGDIAEYVRRNHAPFDIGQAFLAPGLGYEAVLENGLCLFFGLDGRHLRHDGTHDDWDNYHGNGYPGFNHCLAGDLLSVDDLPAAASGYIAENYPGNLVLALIVKPSGKLAVELSGGEVLMFDAAGNFVAVCGVPGGGSHGHAHDMIGDPIWHCDPGGAYGHQNHTPAGGHGPGHHGGMHGNLPGPGEPCWGGTGIAQDNLPAAVADYVRSHYPGAEIVHAATTFGDKYFIRLSDCNRLIFDQDGRILFDSGN